MAVVAMPTLPRDPSLVDDLTDEAVELRARVAALRQLSSQDVVPAVKEIVQQCNSGEEVVIFRKVAGPGRFLGYEKNVHLRFQVTEDKGFHVQEAAVVFGAIAASMPATAWRGCSVVELGCGIGYVSVLLATLGARVVMTDMPRLADLAMDAVALNAQAIRPPGSASFCVLDWARPRLTYAGAARAALGGAAVVVASEPAVDAASQRDFITIARALFGLDGEPPIWPGLPDRQLLVAHKHQQNFCIGGYTAPMLGARQAIISDAEECARCSFRRALEDAGFGVRTWEQAVPEDFRHPFVECWAISPLAERPRYDPGSAAFFDSARDSA